MNHLNFTAPIFLTSSFTFSAEEKEEELQEASAHGARLDYVNCGPANTIDLVLAALFAKEKKGGLKEDEE